jgi:hypothetical protein
MRQEEIQEIDQGRPKVKNQNSDRRLKQYQRYLSKQVQPLAHTASLHRADNGHHTEEINTWAYRSH